MEENTNKENTTTNGVNAASVKQAKDENDTPNNSNAQSAATTGANNDLASQVGSALRGDTGAIKNIYDTAKESGGHLAGQALDQAKEKASSVIDDQKTNLAAGLGSVADGIREVGGNLRKSDETNDFAKMAAKYGDTLAGQIEKVSGYLKDKDLGELIRDVEGYARRNPAVFIGGAFALGFLVARVLKTSNPNQALMTRANTNGEGKTSSTIDGTSSSLS